MKIQTQGLTGPALDWAVETALGGDHTYRPRNYSAEWAQGGPIIEGEGIRLHRSHTGDWWAGSEEDPHRPLSGATPLIAAMRCFVASRLGNEVDIPEDLVA